jgi:hypothetical protein
VHALVVYESMFGNTHTVATHIAEGIGTLLEARIVPVHDATPEQIADADLVVVGGPTHVHGMSNERSRAGAADIASRTTISSSSPTHWSTGCATGSGTWPTTSGRVASQRRSTRACVHRPSSPVGPRTASPNDSPRTDSASPSTGKASSSTSRTISSRARPNARPSGAGAWRKLLSPLAERACAAATRGGRSTAVRSGRAARKRPGRAGGGTRSA